MFVFHLHLCIFITIGLILFVSNIVGKIASFNKASTQVTFYNELWDLEAERLRSNLNGWPLVKQKIENKEIHNWSKEGF